MKHGNSSRRQNQPLTLYDPDLLQQLEPWLFEPRELKARGLLQRRTSGRRSAHVFRIYDRGFVLRHYWRGGLIGRVLDDAYLWTGFRRSRPVREWDLLRDLSQQGLPVPRPAALRLCRTGLLYRADLITVELPASETLVDRLEKELPEPAVWHAIGSTIRELHDAGAYHADLNARNIMLSANGSVHIIDWDRGRIRRPARHWTQANLDRLARSLEKLSGLNRNLHYDASCMEQLRRGYTAKTG